MIEQLKFAIEWVQIKGEHTEGLQWITSPRADWEEGQQMVQVAMNGALWSQVACGHKGSHLQSVTDLFCVQTFRCTIPP